MNHAIIGLGHGDEGKGVVTEYLCSQAPNSTIVIRFSGGQQAGHKVCKDSTEHIFSQFGSGTLSGCPTYWSNYCTFEPTGFWKERTILEGKGIHPRFYIHPDCAVTTPYDVFANREMEREDGTCGTGFYRTKQRHFRDGLTLTVHDLVSMSLSQLRYRLMEIQRDYESEKLQEESIFLDCVASIRHWPALTVTETIPNYRHLVFEGSQGLMLDEHIGHMPHCTPSDVTPRNAMEIAELDEVWLVTRAYQTRHGTGPMTNTEHPLCLINTEKETNTHNEYQGEFRKTVLDLDQLIHAKTEGIDKIIQPSTRVNLVITCIDQLSSGKVTLGGEVIINNNMKEFARLIADSLKINGDLYTNTSPYSTTIGKVS